MEEKPEIEGGVFYVMCQRRSLKDSASNINMMVLGGKVRFECEIRMHGVRLEQGPESLIISGVLGESGTDIPEPLVNDRGL